MNYRSWRDKHRPDVFLKHPKDIVEFFLKNCWKGFFDDKFAATFFLGIVFCSCLGFWVEVIRGGFSWDSKTLTVQLVTIVPALVGTTIVDAFLWHEQVSKELPDKDATASKEEKRYFNVVHALPWVVTLFGCVLVCVSFYAFRVHAVGILYVDLVVTIIIIWCVRAADAKLCLQGNDGNSFSNAMQVTGEVSAGSTRSSDGQNNMRGCAI